MVHADFSVTRLRQKLVGKFIKFSFLGSHRKVFIFKKTLLRLNPRNQCKRGKAFDRRVGLGSQVSDFVEGSGGSRGRSFGLISSLSILHLFNGEDAVPNGQQRRANVAAFCPFGAYGLEVFAGGVSVRA